MNRTGMKLGWLVIPAFLVLLALVGAATAAESRDDFEERAGSQGDGQPQDNGNGNGADGEPSDGTSGQTGEGNGQAGDGAGDPIVIQTEGGEIVVQLDEDGNPVSVVTGDGRAPSDSSRYLTPDEDGNVAGIRVTEEGRIEPVEGDDLIEDDFLLRPEGDSLVVVRPDGSSVVLTPTEEGQLSATDIAIDRTRSPADIEQDRVNVQPADRFGPDHTVDPDGEPLVFGVDGGPDDATIRLELDDDGNLVAGQGSQPDAIEIDEGDRSAIRMDEDGNLEVVPLDEIGPDDTVLVPTEDGFDLVRPDGSRVEFRTGGENDGITATEVDPEGEATELEPNPDGSVTLSDGTTVGPIDFVEDGGTIEQLLDQTSDLPWPWVFGAIALLVLLSGGTAYYLHRNRPANDLDLSRFAVQGVPEDQFEKFLDLLRDDPDPTRAIRLAFYAVERGLAGLPHRRVDETPFEWLGRVERHQPEMAPALTPICDLFAMVRFAPGQATDADRQAMIGYLRQLNQAATEAAAASRMAAV